MLFLNFLMLKVNYFLIISTDDHVLNAWKRNKENYFKINAQFNNWTISILTFEREQF